MSPSKSCLKILFQGETSFVICEASNTYKEVISQAMTRFAIPEDQSEALILTNGKGYVFEAQLLEYFLLLFPCPEITFHLRFDWQRLRRGLGLSKSIKRKRLVEQDQEEEEDRDYQPVAVYRQNCFLGSLPSAGAAPVHRQNCFLREQQQQQLEEMSREPRPEADLQQQDQQPKAKRVRLEICAKPRRTVSTGVTVAAPPTVPMRSIRI